MSTGSGRALFLASSLIFGCRLSHADRDCAPELLDRFPGGWPKALDTGLYWYTSNDVPVKASSSKKSGAYDPSKRTVIYFHGWAGSDDGWTETCQRVTTRCSDHVCPGAAGKLLFESWIRAGWNVGFFYWDQFADEECLRDAEQKIWFDRQGNGLRWKSYDTYSGTAVYLRHFGDVYSVADICAQTLSSALEKYVGLEVRFAGHDIGAQLATRCASMLHQRGHPAAPRRLALLEPYFSKHLLKLFRCDVLVQGEKTDASTDPGVADYAAVATADYARHLYGKGVAVEVYKSSVMTENGAYGNMNMDLERFATLVEYAAHWCGGLTVGPLAEMDLISMKCRHDAALPVYFLGFAEAPRPLYPSFVPNASDPASTAALCPTPSAACTHLQIMDWASRQVRAQGLQKWTQVSGRDTVEVDDDAFSLRPGLSEMSVEHSQDLHGHRASRTDQPLDIGVLPLVVATPLALVFLVIVCLICTRLCGGEEYPGHQTSDAENFSEESRSLVMAQ